MHPLVDLAIQSVKYYLKNGRLLPVPDPLPRDMEDRAGTFVSIKKNGFLRGCIGTIQPKYANLAEEVIQNAVKAANEDPRFEPIEKSELPQLTFSVDVLTPPEKIADLASQNVKRYGLIVSNEKRRGLLLPDLEGVETPARQLEICLKKGGIKKNENYELHRFEVKRFQ